MKRNILYLNPSPQLGGAEKSLLDLVRNLDKERYHPIVSCPAQGKFVEELGRIGVQVEIVPYHPRISELSRENGVNPTVLPLFVCWLTPTVLRLKNLVKDKGVHLIVSNGIKCHFIGAFLSLVSKLPLIWHVRDVVETPWLWWTLRAMGQLLPEKIVTNSEAVGRIFSGNERRETVYNGVDLASFSPEIGGFTLRTELKVGKDTTLIGTMGHLAPLKGFEELIEAVGWVVAQGFDVKLAVAGEAIYSGSPRYKQRLISLVDSLGLNDTVFFLGFKEDIPELLASFDIFVLPSRSEGFGRVNLEAMAMGKPVISTKVGGIPEVVLDGITGILVPPGNSRDLGHAIMRLLNDIQLRESFGKEGRRRVEE
ncbi:MAG: glycosyltransferase, partial [Syntrophobacterales bacterium]